MLAVLLLALFLRLLLLFPITSSAAAESSVLDSLAYRGGDSRQYALLAENLAEHGVFSLSTSAPFVPDIIRTPGYPLFLVPFYVLSGGHNPLPIILAQAFISNACVALVMDISHHLFPGRSWVISGILAALAPASVILTGTVMTETLFALCLLVSMSLVVRCRLDQPRRALLLAAAASLAFAVGALTRPIGLYAFPFLLIPLGLRLGRTRTMMAAVSVALAVYVLALAPWYARNYSHFRALIFSSLGNQNLLIYNVASIEAQRQGISWREAKDQLWAEFEAERAARDIELANEAQMSSIMGEIAVRHIAADPASAAIYQALDSLNTLRPGYSFMSIFLRPSGSDLGQQVQAGELDAVLSAPPGERAVYVSMTAFYGLMYLMASWGALRLLWARRWFELTLLVVLPFSLLIQAGIAGNARFRAPVEGALAMLAAWGWWALADTVRKSRGVMPQLAGPRRGREKTG